MTMVYTTLTICLKLITFISMFNLKNSFKMDYLNEAVSLMKLREFGFKYKNKFYQIVEDESLSNVQPINKLEASESKHCTLNPCEQQVISQLFIQELKESYSFANLKFFSTKVTLFIQWQNDQLLPKTLKLMPNETIYHKVKNFNIYSPVFWYPRLVFKTDRDINLKASIINNPCMIEINSKKAIVTCYPEFKLFLQCQLNQTTYPHGLLYCPVYVSPIQSIGNIINLVPKNHNATNFVQFKANLNFSQLEFVSYNSEKTFCSYTELPMTGHCGGIKVLLVLRYKIESFMKIYVFTIILIILNVSTLWQNIEGPIRPLFIFGIFFILQTYFILNQEYHFSGHYARSSLLEFWLVTCFYFSILMCLQYLIALVAYFFKSHKVIRAKLEIIQYDRIIDKWSRYIFPLIGVSIIIVLFGVITQFKRETQTYIELESEE